MNNQLQILYQHTLAKYKKYHSRFKKSLKSGLYYEYSEKKQRLIAQRIEKLRQRLSALKTQIKMALASGALVLALQSAPVQAQQLGPFVEAPTKNPLPPPPGNPFAREHPAIVDIDNDGDLDVFVGERYGGIAFLRNDGTQENPYFVQVYGLENPANGIDVGYDATPSFADLDKDGDFDLIIGQSYQYLFSPYNNVRYYENTGSKTAPVFTLPSGEHPVDNMFSDGYNSHPAFADIDDDGDLDAFVGGTRNVSYSNRETIKFWRNDGSLPIAQFTAEAGATNPISIANPDFGGTLDHAAPVLIDIDGDNDKDMFVGDVNGDIHFFRNEGTITSPSFPSEITGASNPFDGISFVSYASPEFGDFDNDGDFDAIVGSGPSVHIRYFENIGTATSPNFQEQTGTLNPFSGIEIDYYASPDFVDIDNDGDLDAFIGGKYSLYNTGFVKFYENVSGVFTERTSTQNPLNALITTDHHSPSFVDIDGDKDFDLFLDVRDSIVFYENTGDVSSITLGPPNSALLQATLQGFVTRYKTTFADIDGDGDLDAINGHGYYIDTNLEYYKNTGTATSPSFILDNANNPFATLTGTDLTTYPVPEFVDIDHDGDDDLFVGRTIGDMLFFPNIAGTFDLTMTPSNNPLNGLTAGGNAAPTFADVDMDGDLDAFVGSYNGVIHYFENQNQPPGIATNVGTPIAFTENDSPTILDSGFSISDDGNDNIISAEVAITANYVNGEDVLSFTPQGGVTGSFDASTGVLTLTGYAKLAVYELVLQSVTYQNTSEDPSSAPRIIALSAIDFDATNPTGATTLTINVTPVNDAPVATGSGTGVSYTENSAGTIIDAGVTLSDIDNTTLSGAIVSITTNFISTEDLLEFTDQNGITGSYNASSGVLTLSGTASLANYEAALQSITYRNSSENPDVSVRTVSFVVNDGTDNSNSTTTDVSVIPVNDAPQITSVNSGTNNTYDVDGSPVIVDDQVVLSDADDTDLEGAVVSITGFVSGDLLSFTDQNGITGSYDSQSGVLTLTGTASVANYQTALRSITFAATAAGQRQVQILVNDGDVDSAPYSRTVDVTVNQPPQVSTAPQSTQQGNVVTINLCDLISDPDNTFSELTISVQSISSGAETSITDCILSINYGTGGFSGQDELVIQACDPSGACDQNTINVQVEPVEPTGPLTIYNAVSPNGDGLNDWWEILELSTPNKIELYNRWGDLVKTLNDYVSQDNTLLDDLPAGTYFYKIQSPQGEYTGYLVIKK